MTEKSSQTPAQDEILGDELKRSQHLVVRLASRGNPAFRQDPERPLDGVSDRVEALDSLAEASSTCRAFITAHGLGSGNWRGGQVYDERGHQIAWVSYNGRVWRASGKPMEAPKPPQDRIYTTAIRGLSGKPEVQCCHLTAVGATVCDRVGKAWTKATIFVPGFNVQVVIEVDGASLFMDAACTRPALLHLEEVALNRRFNTINDMIRADLRQ